MISVSGYDHSGFEVTLSKVQTDDMSRDEQVSLVGDMLKQLFYMGVNPKGEKTGRGIETQWITHFVLRKKGDKYEADLFNQYLNMKVVTLYLGDDGIEQRFLEKSGLKSLDGLKVYQNKVKILNFLLNLLKNLKLLLNQMEFIKKVRLKINKG